MGCGYSNLCSCCPCKQDVTTRPDEQIEPLIFTTNDYSLHLDHKTVDKKEILLSIEDDGIPSATIREIALLKQLIHPNIVRLYDVVHKDNALTLHYECFGESLSDYLKENGSTGQGLPQAKIKSFLVQLLHGINFCHENQILHRNLNSSNLLINKKDCTLKLCNIEFGRCGGINVRNMTNVVGVLWYRAPELLMGSKHYTTAIDMWSVGCIFGEMISGHSPFCGTSESDQLMKIFAILGTPTLQTWPGMVKLANYKPDSYLLSTNSGGNLYEDYGGKIDKEGIELLLSFLQFNPDIRMSATKGLQHPYCKEEMH